MISTVTPPSVLQINHCHSDTQPCHRPYIIIIIIITITALRRRWRQKKFECSKETSVEKQTAVFILKKKLGDPTRPGGRDAFIKHLHLLSADQPVNS